MVPDNSKSTDASQPTTGVAHAPAVRTDADSNVDTVFYDGQCGMCQRSVRILRLLDWRQRLAFRDFLSVPEDDRPVDYEVFMQGLPMETGSGRVLVGFPAMRRALMRTPPGAIAAWLLYIPGISHLGSAVYRWIAANRSRACEMSNGN